MRSIGRAGLTLLSVTLSGMTLSALPAGAQQQEPYATRFYSREASR